jgi:hypothetical protein
MARVRRSSSKSIIPSLAYDHDIDYHIIAPIEGTPEAPYIPLWERMGVDHDLPIVSRDTDIPPNRLRLIVVKTVTDAGETTHDINEEVEWELYYPYVTVEYAADIPSKRLVEQPSQTVRGHTAGQLPIPSDFFHEHQLERGEYLECFGLEVLPSGADDWEILYPSVRAGPVGGAPDFEFDDIRATITHRDIELE